ncbi:helix-turn-helix transcriptional regulator [Pseudonocardia xishanensis]|uniref:HTH luxR-type domain-containing protein n=1 Tax=Pseudonocardia xishanensis TaxID=630995 RepID=A0ABP8S577_9PSEU
MAGRDDGDWLEFVGELLREPLTELPLERVTRMLQETFESTAVAVSDFQPDGTVVGRVLPLDARLEGHREDLLAWGRRAAHTHPIVQYFAATGNVGVMQSADVPAGMVDLRLFGDGAALLRDCGVGRQLAFPIGPGPAPQTLVVGKPEVYGPREMALAERVWRLLSGLDRQARAYARALAEAPAAQHESATSIELTPRERGVLGLLAQGHTAGAIARRLGIAERTVHKHLERCYSKLGVADRLSAVLRAQRWGLVAG